MRLKIKKRILQKQDYSKNTAQNSALQNGNSALRKWKLCKIEMEIVR